MAFASHILRQSRKFGSAPSLLRYDHAILVRWLGNNAQSSIDARDDTLKFCRLGYVCRERNEACGGCKFCIATFCHSYKVINPAMISLVGIRKGNGSRTAMKVETTTAGLVFNKGFSCSQLQPRRSFSTDSASCGKETSTEAPTVDTKTAAALDYTDIPHSQIRKFLGSLLLLSKQTIPHYYLTVDACVDKLTDLRSQLNLLQEASGGKRISVNDFVIKATALALRKVPQCNSSWTSDYIRQYHNVNIKVAEQADNGTFILVIRDADKKGLSQIAEEVAEEVERLAQKAKENSLEPEDYEGGTFSVVNLGGPFGVKQFCGIIIPPQSSILAVGSSEKRVIPGSAPNLSKFASFMSVTLSCDHRVVDGGVGAEWLKAFKGYIENPESMLL